MKKQKSARELEADIANRLCDAGIKSIQFVQVLPDAKYGWDANFGATPNTAQRVRKKFEAIVGKVRETIDLKR